jgi:hypothetical protein
MWLWFSSVCFAYNIWVSYRAIFNFNFAATQSLVLTTTVPGVGLRKTPSSLSLLHEIVNLIHREMEVVNHAHEAGVLSLSFQVLTNSCQSQECRNIIAKVSIHTTTFLLKNICDIRFLAEVTHKNY